MNNIFEVFFVGMLIISIYQSIKKRKYMTDSQKRIVTILYTLTILGFAILYYPNLDVIPMPTHYLNEQIAPFIKMWVRSS
jgi:uncharacterized membrane protein